MLIQLTFYLCNVFYYINDHRDDRGMILKLYPMPFINVYLTNVLIKQQML